MSIDVVLSKRDDLANTPSRPCESVKYYVTIRYLKKEQAGEQAIKQQLFVESSRKPALFLNKSLT
jgi:hypothetical protein